jgi:hypothetical protein
MGEVRTSQAKEGMNLGGRKTQDFTEETVLEFIFVPAKCFP